MTPWTEENFLERLVPQLRRQDGMQIGSCPDSETLVAFTEDRVSPFLREAVTDHLRQCRECGEACARLVNFIQSTEPVQDAEWVNTEKRLQNWIDPFLLSRATGRNSKPLAGSLHVLPANDIHQASWWRLMSPAVVVAGVAVLALAGLFLSRRGGLASTPVQVATRQVPLQTVNSAPVPTVQTPDHAGGASKPVEPIKKTSPQIKKDSPLLVLQTPPGPVGDSPPETARPQPSPRPASIPHTDESGVIARGHTPPVLGSNAQILGIPEGASLVPSGPAAASAAPHSSRPELSAQAGTRIPKTAEHPELLRLHAGTQLWIRMVSISRQSDGGFTFRGTLLQPVSDAGGALLEHGTKVAGSGSVKEEVTTVSVRGLLVRGVPYALQSVTGTVSEQTPGAGKAVQFSKGQILQMWISSETVYEKAPDAKSLDLAKP